MMHGQTQIKFKSKTSTKSKIVAVQQTVNTQGH